MTAPFIAIAEAPGSPGSAILDQAIALSGLEDVATAKIANALDQKNACNVIIIPSFDGFDADAATATSAYLVEHLVDRLIDWGATSVAVGSTPGTASLWLENRDVYMLADLLGYQYVTPRGRDYDVLDLSEETVSDTVPAGDILAGTPLSSRWLAADMRIVFAANRTDEDDGYALCLSTLLNALPLTNKDYHYRYRRNPGAVIAALLAASPVDFGLVDAVRSSHGNGGMRLPCPTATDTVIIASDPVLADHYGALKMGLDPFASQLAAPSLRRPHLLDAVELKGSLQPYPGWINVDPLLVDSTRKRSRSLAIDSSVRPILQKVERTQFPFANPINDRANALATSLLGYGDDTDPSLEPAAADDQNVTTLIAANYALGQVAQSQEAWQIFFDKDRLTRRDAPVDIDPATISEADWLGLADELLPQAALLHATSVDPAGLRWRYHDGAVLFDCVRRFPISFDAFVSHVPIHRTIQFMNDYIGGDAITVASDDQDRVTRQIERNLYLPQPNFTVLAGGQVIDVTKIETVVYGPDKQTMFWKTVHSANGSAIADDGIVCFEALGDDVLVTIWARQHFRLPPFLELFDLDLVPDFKAALVQDAYTRFASRTFANLEAVAEGRDVRIGKPWTDEDRGPDLPVERLSELVETLTRNGELDPVAWLKNIVKIPTESGSQPILVDEDGFHHFDPAATPSEEQPVLRIKPAWDSLVGDLQQAARVDFGAPV